MKPFFIFLALLISPASQARTIDDVLAQTESKTMSYRLPSGYLESVVINMSFAGSSIVSIMDKANLKKANVIQVDLVYTNFPKDVDMLKLNKERIQQALEARGDLVSNENISWKLIRQMGCKDEAEAKIMFHGVVIHYLPEQGPALFKNETLSYGELPKNDSTKVKNSDFKQFSDSTVVSVLRRNKEWKNPTIVSDVTCSMSPYASQLLLWFLYKMNDKEACNMVLFNDGDGKANELKVIGSTGGLYSKSSKEYQDFWNLLMTATSKGCSGDTQENGIEGILKAQELFPNSKEIIYIADNYAPLRDISLADKIKIPVRVVICGTQFRTSVELMNLALKTGGSVHTMEKDLTELSKLAEGKVFELNRQKYIIKNGKIELLKMT